MKFMIMNRLIGHVQFVLLYLSRIKCSIFLNFYIVCKCASKFPFNLPICRLVDPSYLHSRVDGILTFYPDFNSVFPCPWDLIFMPESIAQKGKACANKIVPGAV